MKDIILFTDKESELIEKFKTELSNRNNLNEVDTITINEAALRELATAISLYPSIFLEQHLGGTSRSIETLVDNLCLKEKSEMIFNIPSKSILGRGFSISKINFFFMLLYLTGEINELKENSESIRNIIEKNIFSLMAEDVFISIISDKDIPMHIRSNAGYFLANIWEYRMYQEIEEFVPILNRIWLARKKMEPCFGTMCGVSEIFIMSDRSDPMLNDFLQREELNNDEVDSLMEFLMGLSFEEMGLLTGQMEETGISSLSKDEIDKMFGKKKAYPDYIGDDPREFYKFFMHRKDNADYRSKSGLEGPKKTIEEYIMCYLLTRAEHI